MKRKLHAIYLMFTSNNKMKEDINKAVEVLNKGGVILYPTDTIWGLGCDATNEDAVKRIYEIKNRTDSKSMLVLLDNINKIASYVVEVPEIALDIVEVSDKPTTIIYPGAKNLAKNLISDDGSIGIRIVDDKFCQNLIQRFKKPLVSSSANISGHKSPANFTEISEDIIKNVDFVVNYKQDDNSFNRPSSIISVGLGGEIKIIRE